MEGESIGHGLKIAVIVARFNEMITKSLLEGTLNELRRAGVRESDLDVLWVPGAFEIPVAAKEVIQSKQIDGLAALGCIIKGETPHHESIAKSVSVALQRIAVDSGVPIGFRVFTVDSLEQAFDRAGGKLGNRGRDAARSIIETVNLLRVIPNQKKKKL